METVTFVKVGNWDRPCKDCGRSQPDVAFGHSASGGKLQRKSYCRQCQAARSVAHDRTHPEQAKAREARRRRDWSQDAQRRVAKAGPGFFRAKNIKAKFGIELSDYQERFRLQGGSCAICGAAISLGGSGRAALDHDHSSGKIRAFLCTRCNVMLGMACDRPEILVAAAKYLEIHRG